MMVRGVLLLGTMLQVAATPPLTVALAASRDLPVKVRALPLRAMLPVLLSGDLHAFWRDTISYQGGRGSPFSIWGLWGIPGPQRIFQGAAVALVLAVAFIPERRTVLEVAALAAAVLIALQLVITHWFYLYIPWFFPPVIFALICAHPPRDPALRATTERSEQAPAPELSPAPASAR